MKQLATGDTSHVLCADGGVLYTAELLSLVSLDTISMVCAG